MSRGTETVSDQKDPDIHLSWLPSKSKLYFETKKSKNGQANELPKMMLLAQATSKPVLCNWILMCYALASMAFCAMFRVYTTCIQSISIDCNRQIQVR